MSDPDLDREAIDITDEETLLFDRASKAGSGLSLVLCTIVLIIYAVMLRYQPKLAKRVSLKLVMVGIVCDFLYAMFYLLSALPQSAAEDKLCAATMFLQLAFLLGSLFSTASIGLNLLLVFVIKVGSDRPIERIYYSVSAVVALVVPLSALCAGRFGYDGAECWYRIDPEIESDVDAAFAWQWGTYYAWVLAVCCFCFACGLLFQWSVHRPMGGSSKGGSDMAVESVTQNRPFSNTERLVRRAVQRIQWYCVVPILAHVWSLASDIQYHMTDYSSVWLWAAANFMSSAMGALHALIFFIFDPSFHNAYNSARIYLVYKHYLRHFKAAEPLPMVSQRALRDVSSPTPSKISSLNIATSPTHSGIKQNSNGDSLDQTSSIAGKKTHLIPRVSDGKRSFMFHIVRVLLVRDNDINKFLKGAQRKPSMRVNASTSSRVGGESTSMGTDKAVDALQDSIHVQEAEAADELDRL
ncbi:hypothetical protein DFJ77DRAFT_453405 [Powellomyces hirtus]|nr:hypothetical protein DFJ77DRAFT_453405 [Powellomyces hirtus]